MQINLQRAKQLLTNLQAITQRIQAANRAEKEVYLSSAASCCPTPHLQLLGNLTILESSSPANLFPDPPHRGFEAQARKRHPRALPATILAVLPLTTPSPLRRKLPARTPIKILSSPALHPLALHRRPPKQQMRAPRPDPKPLLRVLRRHSQEGVAAGERPF